MYFLSEENVLCHKDFLKEIKLKLSVLEKSCPAIKGLDLKDVSSLKLSREDKREALKLKSEIMLHELYFESFSDKFYSCEAARKFYGSEANFLYEIEREILKHDESGFLIVFFDTKKRLSFEFSNNFLEKLMNYTPILAIDLWEHAYFKDFGFDRKRYVKCALSQLNFDKINDFSKSY